VTAIRARCVVNPACSLGEGPIWDAASQRLYWVDILVNRIYRFDPADASTAFWTTPEHVGFVVFPSSPGSDVRFDNFTVDKLPTTTTAPASTAH